MKSVRISKAGANVLADRQLALKVSEAIKQHKNEMLGKGKIVSIEHNGKIIKIKSVTWHF